MKMSETLSKTELSSLVSDAVAEAMKVSALECPDCHATFTEPARYMDHRISETFAKAVEEVKAPDPEKLVLDCKDGICKMISEHVEATYDIHKKGETPVVEEEETGLYSEKDDPEE